MLRNFKGKLITGDTDMNTQNHDRIKWRLRACGKDVKKRKTSNVDG